jgi:DNA invertase Pin-like site-specific DNA recombinase
MMRKTSLYGRDFTVGNGSKNVFRWKTLIGGRPYSDQNSLPTAPLTPAAQYVRMSTDHQNYSTLNQEAAIAEYAARRRFEIVKTYADEGKSGLRLEGREALRDLLRDVQLGRAGYKAILVYDISRWGRFQDADEAAYLEYTCKRSGITVHYCAEQFENDDSMTSTVFKGMKRVMAGEYSRELSVKVFRGQCRLIGLGFRQGGPAGFGLRRQLVNKQRQPKALLSRGEHKSIQTDRVILVPGPEDEVAIVRRIYRMFTIERIPEREIAVALNMEGIRTDLGRPWTFSTVKEVLTNEKYAGSNVFNRTSFKLKQTRVENGPDLWVRMDQAFEALIDQTTFQAAKQIIEARSRRYSNQEMLDLLTSLYLEKELLSGLIIDEQENMPSSAAYRNRFGSLVSAYGMVGYSTGRDYEYFSINRELRRMYPDIIADTVAQIEKLGGGVRLNRHTDGLVINEEFTASIVIARCQQTSGGALRWRINLDTGLRPDVTVAIRMQPCNCKIRDYYLLPGGNADWRELRLSEQNGAYLDVFRADTLDRFIYLAERIDVRRAA